MYFNLKQYAFIKIDKSPVIRSEYYVLKFIIDHITTQPGAYHPKHNKIWLSESVDLKQATGKAQGGGPPIGEFTPMGRWTYNPPWGFPAPNIIKLTHWVSGPKTGHWQGPRMGATGRRQLLLVGGFMTHPIVPNNMGTLDWEVPGGLLAQRTKVKY